MSGGQQRMLSLARVLAVTPRVLVVDELSLGLAPVVIDSVYEGLLAIRDSGCALLVVEQQVDRALAIADTAILLAHGSVAWTGPAPGASTAMEELLAGRQMAASDDLTASRASGERSAGHRYRSHGGRRATAGPDQVSAAATG